MNVGTYRSNTPETLDLPYLEGQFDLGAELGAIPEKIYLAVGLWESPDGGSMLPDFQVPEARKYPLIPPHRIHVSRVFAYADASKHFMVRGIDPEFFKHYESEMAGTFREQIN